MDAIHKSHVNKGGRGRFRLFGSGIFNPTQKRQFTDNGEVLDLQMRLRSRNIPSRRAPTLMPENKSSSKKQRMDYDLGCDRLSELPSSIIKTILLSVPTVDAVRMSILSRQFRYMWTTLPHLVFDDDDFGSGKFMEKFVTNALKLHKGTIHKFEMSVWLNYNRLVMSVDDLLLLLPKNEIRELTLNLGYGELTGYQVHSDLYSCNKLINLELRGYNLGPPPLTFTGFLFLRCLVLVNAYISFNDIGSIVAKSPFIESLKLRCCLNNDDENPELRISAPNLKYLDFGFYPLAIMQIYLCAPLLAEMSASIGGLIMDHDYEILRERCSNYSYVDFFGGCTNLQKLRGNFMNTAMSYGIDSCHYSFDLPHLQVLELDSVDFEDVKERSLVVRLVAGTPNLQQLKISCGTNNMELEAPDVSYIDVLRALNFKLEKLRIVEMRFLTGLLSETEFLKLLLENSPALESLNLKFNDRFACKKAKKFRAEVLECNHASPNVKICFPKWKF